MIRNKLGCFLAAVLLVGLMQACGGGGGGGGVDTTIDVTGPNAPAVFDASGQNYTFLISSGSFLYTITNFASGDVLDFQPLPAGVNLELINEANTPGYVILRWLGSSAADQVDIKITGLTQAQDDQLYNLDQFKALFGQNSIL